MYFDSLQAVIDMDGHGAFVWAAYAITLAVLATLLITPVLKSRRLRRELAGQIKRAAQAGAPNEVSDASGS